jgi:hypothetical protein
MNDKKIQTVAEFADVLSKISLKKDCIRFFRGHADLRLYKLRPSVYRKLSLRRHEENIIKESIMLCPADFPKDLSFFEHLVKLQHYGLPTRLLDITSNALAALYFACREKEKTEGEVIVFDIPKDEVKYYSSDTVSVIANIARRPFNFDLTPLPKKKEDFNRDPEIGRLLYDIREDKPSFISIIEPTDLSRVICVRAKLDNARIARQDGAFLLFGIVAEKSEHAVVPKEWIVRGPGAPRITFTSKYKIKRELEQFGVSEQTLFPELYSQSKSIIAKFSAKKYQRRSRVRLRRRSKKLVRRT